jgi:hypothetical protein
VAPAPSRAILIPPALLVVADSGPESMLFRTDNQIYRPINKIYIFGKFNKFQVNGPKANKNKI